MGELNPGELTPSSLPLPILTRLFPLPPSFTSPPPPPPPIMSATSGHQPIARPQGLPGYCPRQWCCVCGKAAAKTDTYVKCQGDTCLNLCHIRCLDNKEDYSCKETQALRVQANVTDQVVFTTGSSAPKVDADQDQDQETIEKEEEENEEDSEDTEHLTHLGKEQLIETIIQLQKEVSKSNNIIRSYKNQRELLINKRSVFEEALSLIDIIVATDIYNKDSSTTSVAASAAPDKIDSDWEDVCNKSEHWKNWRDSSKPRPLKKISQLVQTESISLGNEQPRINSGSNNTNNTNNTKSNSTATTTYNKTAGQKTTSRGKPAPKQRAGGAPDCGVCGRRGHTENTCRARYCNYCGKLGHTEDVCWAWQRTYCDHCGSRGHTTDQCRRSITCEYCSRRGHDTNNCLTRAAEQRQDQRQEQLIRSILKEYNGQIPHTTTTPGVNYQSHLPTNNHSPHWHQNGTTWPSYTSQNGYNSQTQTGHFIR